MKISLLLTILGLSTNTAYAASSDTLQFLRGIAVEGSNACDCVSSNDCPSGQYCDANAGDDGTCNIKQNGSIYGKCTNDNNRNQCYNLGATCNVDDDCWQGGYNPCNSCGQSHGTQYYKRCYYTPPPTPAPYEQPQCYNLGASCNVDNDCLQGGYNPCNSCGQSHGTQYYKRCYYTPPPTPSPNEPGMCRVSCYNDSDCKSEYAGTWNPCMVCSRNHGAAAGTRYNCIEPPETPSPTPTDDDDWDRTNSQPCNYKDTHKKGGTGCRVPGQICVKTGDLPCETDNTYNGCCVPTDDWLNEMNELMEQSSV